MKKTIDNWSLHYERIKDQESTKRGMVMSFILSETVVKARKEHRCDMCKGRIEIGEGYCRSFSVDGGDNWLLKEHLECKEKREDMCSNCVNKFDCETSLEECFYEKVTKNEQD